MYYAESPRNPMRTTATTKVTSIMDVVMELENALGPTGTLTQVSGKRTRSPDGELRHGRMVPTTLVFFWITCTKE